MMNDEFFDVDLLGRCPFLVMNAKWWMMNHMTQVAYSSFLIHHSSFSYLDFLRYFLGNKFVFPRFWDNSPLLLVLAPASFILQPDFGEQEVKVVVEKVKEIAKNNKGKCLNTEPFVNWLFLNMTYKFGNGFLIKNPFYQFLPFYPNPKGQGWLVLPTQALQSPKGENPPALDHRKQRVDAPLLGGWEVR